MTAQTLLTGATGFIGGMLHDRLLGAGLSVRCLTRQPKRAKERFPERNWQGGDAQDPDSLRCALEGCQVVHRSEPVAVGDVLSALVRAASFPLPRSDVWDLPGPEALSGTEILMRVAQLMGRRPLVVRVPFVSPHLSSHWIRLVTRVDYRLAAELVEGLTSDILAGRPGFWEEAELSPPLDLEEAARRALAEEASTLPARDAALERLAKFFTRRA